MEIVYRTARTEYELDVQVNDRAVPASRLAAALARASSTAAGLVVDGTWMAPERSLDEVPLVVGSSIQVATSPPSGPIRCDLVLRARHGLDSGWSLDLAPGRHVLGRDADECDVVVTSPTVSRRHAVLTVTADGGAEVESVSDRSVTTLDRRRVTGPSPVPPGAVLRIGAVELSVEPPETSDVLAHPQRAVTPAGTVPFNRPPRRRTARQSTPLTAPSPPPERQHQPVSIASMFLPAVAAVIMSVALHQTTYLFLGLLTPVIGVVTMVEDRRRTRRDSGKLGKEFSAAVAEFEREVARLHTDEAASRRADNPDLAELARRATAPSVRLWERRPDDPDFLRLALGSADVPWEPPVDLGQPKTAADPVAQALARNASLEAVPVTIDAAKGAVLGVVGGRNAALSVARGLVCQASVMHGPADLGVVVMAGTEVAVDWEWAKWLPHTAGPVTRGWAPRLAAGPAVSSLLDSVEEAQAATAQRPRPLLVVIDDEVLATSGDPLSQRIRQLLRSESGLVVGIVMAGSRQRLVNFCTTVVEVDEVAPASVEWPDEARRVDRMLPWGMEEHAARGVARGLARFSDPEVSEAGAGLPDSVRLLTLLGLDAVTPSAMAARWEAHRVAWDRASGRTDRASPPFGTAIGVGTDGPVFVDLIHDGPHAMIGGMTGSGKSELLSSLVMGLAATVPPQDLVFGLFDFKGGAAFRPFETLPHTVGTISDLDSSADAGASTAERALVCLRAELQLRKTLFQQAGVPDWRAYRARVGDGLGQFEPLPRLVVVIDEFASMAEKVPGLFASLDQIAREGRSLGVHLVLATQKPAGVIDADMRANTNLWICLRVQDRADSMDVVGVGDAVAISRPGRAYVKVGPRNPVAVQTALATAVSAGGRVEPVTVQPFIVPSLGERQIAAQERADPDAPLIADPSTAKNDLERLVEAAKAAFETSGAPAPRCPFPEPLPGVLTLTALDESAATAPSCNPAASVVLALADDPEHQTRFPVGWELQRGNLLVAGRPGSGKSNALAAAALQLARTQGPDRLHLYVVDFGAGGLSSLGKLAHTGAYIGATERERQVRLIRLLRSELAARKEAGANGGARLVVLIDGFDAMRAEFDDAPGAELMDQLHRVFSEGPEVDIHMALSVGRAGGVPHAWLSVVPQRLVLATADPVDLGTLGVPSARGTSLGAVGRAYDVASGKLCQLAWAGRSLDAAVAGVPGGDGPRRARPIGTLPELVVLEDVLMGATAASGDDWHLPFAIGDGGLTPVGLRLYEGEHALVGGPSRSGKSCSLRAIAAAARRTVPQVRILGVAGRRSGLVGCADVDELLDTERAAKVLGTLSASPGAHLILVDDAERLDDEVNRTLDALLALRRPDVHVVAAGRPDFLRSLYGHWTQTVRKSRAGLLLRPDVDLDGDLLGVSLPRRTVVRPMPGRGYLVDNGEVELVQVAITNEAQEVVS